MTLLKFSICRDYEEDIEPFEMALLSYTKDDQNPVKLQTIAWDRHMQELRAIGALNDYAMDVSQVPSTTINQLIAMDALRPFTKDEIASFGGASVFASVSWSGTSSENEVYAIPWIIDTRAIIYRRDIFEQAGIDETTAFTSFDNMENAFERLQEKGFPTPWGVATANKFNAFQTACTWIWGLGGEIGQGDQILFDRPEAIDALVRYFKLYRFMPKPALDPNPFELWNMFQEGKVATILNNISIRSLASVNGAKIGATVAPGPTYVGGSSLVVWRHARNTKQAVELVRHLTSSEIQLQFALLSGSMPSRSDILDDIHFTKTPNLRIFLQTILLGRTYANLPLGGLIEELFTVAIGNMWNKIIANPEIDIKPVLLAEIDVILKCINAAKC